MKACRPALVGLAGTQLQAPERDRLRALRPAGVLLFARNAVDPDQLRALVTDVRRVLAEAGIADAIVAVDQEGGAVTPLDRILPGDPSAASLGWANRTELTRSVHAERGRALRALGIDLVLGPVADVDRPGNPVIATRAFGDRTGPVCAHVEAAVRGLHDGGVRACAKHWPGHGAPRADSHLELPVLELDETTRLAIDAPPFAAAARAGVDAVMLAHLHVPAWRAGPALPIGVDPRAVQRLRAETGFTGPLLSDAVEMHGLGPHPPRALLSAGIDLVLFARPVGQLGVDVGELPATGFAWPTPRLRAGTTPVVQEEGWAEAVRRRGGAGALLAIRRAWVVDAASNDRLFRIPDDAGAPLEGGRPGEVDLWRELLPEVAAHVLPLEALPTAEPPPWTEQDAVVVLAVRPLPEAVQSWITTGARPRVLLRFGAAALHAPWLAEAEFCLECPEIRRPALRRILRAAGAGWGY
jgi:beta-glucosidase-like glycosyl hydrolase